MDLDAFIRAHQDEWERLDRLVDRARRHRGRRLSAEELDELLALYQRATTHLSLARTRLAEPRLAQQLSRRVARAAAVVHGAEVTTWGTVRAFVMDTFPVAVWHLRRHIAIAALTLIVPWLVVGFWMGSTPAALELAGPEAVRAAYVEEDFEAYYTDPASAEFATLVTTNNIQVGILAFALGILLCVPTLFVLAFNGLNVGLALGLFIAADQQGRFWALILPHGLLELTAIFIAGGAGLALGWAIIDPGDRTRGEALTVAARQAITIVIGLFAVFTVAGLIEGYVTGADMPAALKLAIGGSAWGAFCAYVWLRGRDAEGRGLSGSIGEEPYSRPEALTSR